MTFNHVLRAYCIWIWGQWSRLSAFFITTCVIAALTIGMAQTTRRYNQLCDRVQSAFRRQDTARLALSSEARDAAGHREREEVLHKLDEILARLPEGREASVSTHGPLSSSH